MAFGFLILNEKYKGTLQEKELAIKDGNLVLKYNGVDKIISYLDSVTHKDQSQDEALLALANSISTTILTTNNTFNGTITFTKPIVQTIDGQLGWNAITTQDFGVRNPSASATFLQFKEKIFLYGFPYDKTRELQCGFVVPHNYAPDTIMYPYIDVAVNTTKTGSITFGIEYTVSKCAGGTSSPITVTKFVKKSIVASDVYKNLRLELPMADAIPAASLEVGAAIHIRIFRGDEPTSMEDTYCGYVFVSSAGINYQVGSLITKNKSPNFYN